MVGRTEGGHHWMQQRTSHHSIHQRDSEITDQTHGPAKISTVNLHIQAGGNWTTVVSMRPESGAIYTGESSGISYISAGPIILRRRELRGKLVNSVEALNHMASPI